MDIAIGELARRSSVKVPTIRFYEQIGLMPAAPRTEGGQRRYGQNEIDRLNFIRHARELGFEVEAIRSLLDMSGKPQSSCHQADSIAFSHLTEVERRIKSLQALKKELTRMVTECGHGKVCDCQIIKALANHSLCQADHLKVRAM